MIRFNTKEYELFFGKYDNGNTKIIGIAGGNKLEITIDINYMLKLPNVFIDNQSEKQGLVEALIFGGYIYSQPVDSVDCGYYQLKSFCLTDRGLNHMNYQRMKNKGIKSI